MKINEAEQLLGITKANIRFYEKEGLLSPSRNESGYRDYTEADIALLKQIVILRKLGIPVQQIGDILDGVLPLQEAIDSNITSLQNQIDALNGALALSRQIQSENQAKLDTDRYWELLRNQESQGFQFHALVDDYLNFTELNYDWILWPLPGQYLRNPWKVCAFILGYSLLMSLFKIPLGVSFFGNFFRSVLGLITSLIIWTAVFVPIYLLRRRNPKLAEGIMTFLLVATPIVIVLLFCLVLYLSYNG